MKSDTVVNIGILAVIGIGAYFLYNKISGFNPGVVVENVRNYIAELNPWGSCVTKDEYGLNACDFASLDLYMAARAAAAKDFIDSRSEIDPPNPNPPEVYEEPYCFDDPLLGRQCIVAGPGTGVTPVVDVPSVPFAPSVDTSLSASQTILAINDMGLVNTATGGWLSTSEVNSMIEAVAIEKQAAMTELQHRQMCADSVTAQARAQYEAGIRETPYWNDQDYLNYAGCK